MNNWKRLSFLKNSQLKEIQNAKLRLFISNQLYPFSPYYRKLFDQHKIKPRHIKTVEDLKIIPFTSKQDLVPSADNPKKFLEFVLQPNEELIKKHSAADRLLYLAYLKAARGSDYAKKVLKKEYQPIFLTATTGTTQQPVSFLYTDFDIQNLHISGFRLLEVFGGGDDIRGVNLFPYAPHLAFWQTVFAGIAHNCFILSTGGGKVMTTQANIDTIVKIASNIVIGEPNYLYHLARAAKEQGKDFSSVSKIVLGASRVPLGFKEKLASIFESMGSRNVWIVGTYGFTESKSAWGECPSDLKDSSGYHIYPDKDVFEVIDPVTGEVKKEGEDGELVYTSIDARGSCVLRYRTGDLVKGGIIYQPCPYCKRTVPRISSNISRASNIKDLALSKVKGTLVNLNDIASILESRKEVDEWQVQIRKKGNDPFEVDELLIYLSLNGECGNQDEIKEIFKKELKTKTEVAPNDIIILSHQQMIEQVEMERAHKAKRFVDNRPK